MINACVTASLGRPVRQATLCIAAIFATLLFSGCVTAFDTNRKELESLHAEGRYDIAAQILDDPKVKEEYGQKNVLLYWLDRGSIALALRDPAGTVNWLDRADNYMEVKREPTAGDEFARWLINDTITPYYGSSYEELYANVFKLLAQLELGNINGGATVEARRMAGKADVLRDRYIRTRDAVAKQGDAGVQAALTPAGGSGYVDVNVGGQFIDSSLGDFLTAIAFMKDGDRENQRVAGKRMASSISLQANTQRDVNPGPLSGVGELEARDVNVLVVGLSGRGPTKIARTIGPIPLYQWPLYMQLPVLQGGSEEVASARIMVQDAGAANLSPGGVPLFKIEDMRMVAEENFRRELPLIYARTILRSSIKAAAAYAATQAVKNQAHGDTKIAAQLGMIVAGLAFEALTEKADLRSWVFLPARADAGLLKLPPGRHLLRVEYLSGGGWPLYAGPWHEVNIPAADGGGGAGAGGEDKQIVTVVEHFWR